jgi:RNA polymerase sigma factor (sigma-70 family)
MRVCRGVRGLPRCSPSLPSLYRERYATLSPTPEDWAFLLDNRKLFYKAAARVFGRNIRWFTGNDILNSAALPVMAALRDWTSAGKASKETLAFVYARNHFTQASRDLYLCRGGPGLSRHRPPVHLGDYTLVEEAPRGSTVTQPAKQQEDAACLARVATLVDKIDPRQRDILLSYLGITEHKTIETMARERGLSTERISQLVEKAVEELRELYGYTGFRPIRPLPPRPWGPRKMTKERAVQVRKYQETWKAKKREREGVKE